MPTRWLRCWVRKALRDTHTHGVRAQIQVVAAGESKTLGFQAIQVCRCPISSAEIDRAGSKEYCLCRWDKALRTGSPETVPAGASNCGRVTPYECGQKCGLVRILSRVDSVVQDGLHGYSILRQELLLRVTVIEWHPDILYLRP